MISSNLTFILAALTFILLIGGFFVLIARVRRVRPLTIERHLPAAKKALLTDCEIYYRQQGSGPHLLLLHGIGASSYIWRFIFKALSRRYTVTAIDFPGFGQSSKNPQANYDLDSQTKRVLELLEKLKINRVQIVGSSMGGTIGLWMARIKPSLVEKVIALAPATNKKLVKITPDRFKAFTGPLARIIGPKLVKTFIQLVLYDRAHITEEDYKVYAQPYIKNKDAMRTFILATRTLVDDRLPKELGFIECPVIIVWGNKDRMIRKKYMNELNSIIPQSKVIILENIGHHPMEESPEKTVKVLIENLN